MKERDYKRKVILKFDDDDCVMVTLGDVDEALREHGFVVVKLFEEEQKQ